MCRFFFFIGASATKSFAGSRIFRYGLPKDILSKVQKTKGGGRTAPPPPPWVKGLIILTFICRLLRLDKFMAKVTLFTDTHHTYTSQMTFNLKSETNKILI